MTSILTPSAQIQSEQNFAITTELINKFYSVISSEELSDNKYVNFYTKFTEFKYTLRKVFEFRILHFLARYNEEF